MSPGSPSNLGTLLVQRLDAVLGTTLSQQISVAQGATTKAVSGPGQPESPDIMDNRVSRHPRESVEHTTAQSQNRPAVQGTSSRQSATRAPAGAVTHHPAALSAPTTFGEAARIILAVLKAYPQAEPTIHTRAPLLPDTMAKAMSSDTVRMAAPAQTHPPQDAISAKIADGLARAVRTSGLFYEAHLAQWAAGRYPRAELEKEPQAKAGSEPPRFTAPPHHSPGPQPPAASDLQASWLVRQQLDALANQGFSWQGEAWPGVPTHWTVRREPQSEHSSRTPSQPEATSWSSRLTLRLRVLGEVEAHLDMTGDRLRLRLAGSPQVTPRLSEATAALRERLLARGLQAEHLRVVTTESPDTGEFPS